MTSKKALKELKNNFVLGVIGRSLCEIIEQDLGQLEKYKKAIDILKDNLCIEFDDQHYMMVKFKRDKDDICDYTILYLENKQEYALLKEVLENDDK